MSTLIVGLGTRDRGDDAVGLVVADALAARGVAPVLAWEGPEIDLIDELESHDRIVIIDAARSGQPPGSHQVSRIDDLQHRGTTRNGSHAFGLARALELAGLLGRLPASIEIHSIEIASLHHGAPLSPLVAASARRLADELCSTLTPR